MKGQSEVLSAVLLSGILIGVVGSVYFWGIPLIQKNKDSSLLQTSESFMDDLDAKIKFVANNGGRDTLLIKVPVIVRFDGKRMELVIDTEGTIYATDAEIPLGRTSYSSLLTDPADPTTKYGIWGVDDPVLFNVKSRQVTKNKYVTTYSLEYVKLRNENTLKDYKIELTGSGMTGGQEKTIVIESVGDTADTINGRTLISSWVKISIV